MGDRRTFIQQAGLTNAKFAALQVLKQLSYDPNRTTVLQAALPITAGMAAQVEIITGRRSVISYILSPIARATAEARRER